MKIEDVRPEWIRVEPYKWGGWVVSIMVKTGEEADVLSGLIPPMKDKHDVLLDFVSNPNALLNALHQAGWEVIPRKKS